MSDEKKAPYDPRSQGTASSDSTQPQNEDQRRWVGQICHRPARRIDDEPNPSTVKADSGM